ncbi:hypothetical protein EW146_g6663 [Bondarzewia mesenterica]|uniref:Threonylcarbamoyl-AMP synthase n=1 Tax=Bondarzewia mesenterica TaxID=1095465 RepID=A0A4S4LNK8_9AGAM|nr:hypothetical protein EW146_g6663 [Bondarzewia mesenterica]
MTISAHVFKCEPSSISFSSDDEPEFKNESTRASIAAAAYKLNAAEPVAFPTETVYGLGALALDARAAARIFSTKGRPADNPLIVHVSSQRMLNRLLPSKYTPSRSYEILMKRFWPGPLTLLFPSDPSIIPPIITANHPTVAIRMPSHPVARALIALAGAPIAAPSANSSGKPSPTRAEHVLKDLGGKLDIILDGGPCDVGLESTVVDGLGEDGNIRVLRPGGVTVEDIERALTDELGDGEEVPRVLVHTRDFQDAAMEATPTTPGMKYRHYSPSVPVSLLHISTPPPAGKTSSTLSDLFSSLASSGSIHPVHVGLLTPSDSRILEHAKDVPGIEWLFFPLGTIADPALTAQRLFDGLLTLEERGADIILVEAISEENEGLAVMNRVKKAAGESKWIQL